MCLYNSNILIQIKALSLSLSPNSLKDFLYINFYINEIHDAARFQNMLLISHECKLCMRKVFFSVGVREKRAECERSCVVSLVRLFTWRIRRGGSRKGERWINRQKHGFCFGERAHPLCAVERAFQNVSGTCLPDKRSRGKKRSSD